MAVYYKTDSSTFPATMYLTNEEKTGYTLRPENNMWTAGKNVVIELYNDKFILPKNCKVFFFNAENSSFNDMDKWDWSEVECAQAMFVNCANLISVDLSTVNSSSITDMYEMFEDCTSLTSIDMSNFNTSNVTTMKWMFRGCSSITTIKLGRWDTSKVEKMEAMFRGCTSLEKILAYIDFDTNSVDDDGDEMFWDCTSLVGGNGTTYETFKDNKDYAKIDKPGQVGYFTDPSEWVEHEMYIKTNDTWIKAEVYG